MVFDDGSAQRRAVTPRGWWRKLEPDQRAGWRVAGAAFLLSRALVLLSGVAAVAIFGYSDQFDTARGINPYDGAARALFSAVAAWDAGQYLGIALQGYDADPARMTFFPLYPLLIHLLGTVIASVHLAGLAISCSAFLLGLYLLYRLTELELGESSARRTVAVTAFCPMAFFFSAIYTESLFLALSLGSVYSARLGRWPAAGALGGMAALARNAGVLLLVPLVLLLVCGPRGDGVPRAPPGTKTRRTSSYALDREALWLLLVPIGVVVYLGYSTISTGDPLTPLRGQAEFGRHFTGPVVAIVDAVRGAGASARDILAGASLLGAAGGEAFVRNRPLELATFIAALVATVGALRHLPLAYGAYAVASLIFVISAPNETDAFLSLPRFTIVIFPLFMWLGHWTHTRARMVIVGTAWTLLLSVSTAAFATWHFVA